MDDTLYNAKRNDGAKNMAKTVYFTAGAPGSGKSYVTAMRLPNLVVVDCDKHKAAHPDYDPKNPGALHAWSSEQATKEFFNRLAGAGSFIFDGTGTDTAKLANFMKQATLCGFETEVVFVKVSMATAIRRNAERTRSVPTSLVREKFALVATSVEILATYADRVTVVNND